MMAEDGPAHVERHASRSDYRMHGAALRLLRLSRAFCVAPVTFVRPRFLCIVRVSRTQALWARAFLTLLAATSFFALCVDVYKKLINTNGLFWTRPVVSIVIWISMFFATNVVLTSSACGILGRVRRFMFYITRAREIYGNIENELTCKEQEKILTVNFILLVSGVLLVCIMKVIVNANGITGSFIEDSWVVFIVVVSSTVNNVLACLLELQVIFVVTSILWSFKSVNKRLEKLLALLEQSGPGSDDRSAVVGTIHAVSKVYGSLVDLGKQVNETEGGTILLLLYYYSFRFMTNLDYFLTSYHNAHNTDSFIWWIINISSNLGHCVYIAFCLLILIEPCHRTHEEMMKTQVLVSQLLCCPSSARDPVSIALACVYEDRELGERIYVPYGVCEISRSLYSALIGVVSTFLIIVVQFGLKY